MVRLFEPLFKLLVAKQIYQFWGEVYEPKPGEEDEVEMQIASDSLSTFLSSSLNVELVYIILTSITAFSDKDERQTGAAANSANMMQTGPEAPAHPINLNQSDAAFMQEVATACSVCRPHILKEIEIHNVAKWDSAKAKDFISNKVTTEKKNSIDGKAQAAEGAKDLSINEEVKITEYAPSVFKTVKFMDQITPDMIKHSLSTEKNHKSVFKAKESAGKSGSFFFFSFDRRFIIKTMNASEK